MIFTILFCVLIIFGIIFCIKLDSIDNKIKEAEKLIDAEIKELDSKSEF